LIAEVEQATGGRVKFNVLTGACPDPEIFDVVAKGAGDIGFNPIMFNTGRFPSLEAMTVPDIGTVCRHPSRVAWDLWKTFPAIDAEFHEAKLVGVFASTQSPPGIAFATVDKPIYKLEDFQGLKIGIYGEWGTKMWAAVGGVPVAVPPPQVYESVQRKIVDGSAMDPEMLEAQAIYEVVKYWHNLCFLFCPFFIVMNNDTWSSLPPDIQKIILDKAALLPDIVDADFRESTVRAIDTGVNEYGMEVIDYS
jgi:TRAP-type C4-dicarboxylate transport system substrate-binding protein